MKKHHQPWLAWRDLPEACVLLTRLPVPFQRADVAPRGASAGWCYPIVGGFIGAIGLLVCVLAAPLGPSLAAALALGVSLLITGALHEDGLADSADGLWGGWDRKRRLEIMRDSRIGTYGVLALIVTLLIRWQALEVVVGASLGAGWIAAAAFGRAAMVVVMYSLPHARGDGLAFETGRPSVVIVALALVLALMSGGIWLASLLWAIGVFVIVTGGIVMIARSKVGGQTGDILGATCVLVETGVLMVIAWSVL